MNSMTEYHDDHDVTRWPTPLSFLTHRGPDNIDVGACHQPPKYSPINTGAATFFFECRREALLRVTSAMKDLGVSEAAPALCAFWNATWPTRSLGQTSATSDVAARKRGEKYPLLVASVALLAQVAL